jgi:hypothetical protein
MRVRYIGTPGDPDVITQYGFTFERKGKAVEVPDDHRMAAKFVNNRFFDTKGPGVDDLIVEPPVAGAEEKIIEPPANPQTA